MGLVKHVRSVCVRSSTTTAASTSPPSCSQSAAAAAAAANEDYLMGLLTEAGKELKALRKDMQELERQLVDAKVGVDEREG